MIVTDLEHVNEQIALTPSLQKAFEFLRQSRTMELAGDRIIEIDGTKVYAHILSYETHSGVGAKFEAHTKYLDIGYVVSGEETIAWALVDRLIDKTPYDAAKDACYGTVLPQDITPVRLSAGHVTVLYPTDAHAPRQAVGAPSLVTKIIVKVAV